MTEILSDGTDIFVGRRRGVWLSGPPTPVLEMGSELLLNGDMEPGDPPNNLAARDSTTSVLSSGADEHTGTDSSG